MTTRFLYQPHDGQTVCGSLALPQRGQSLRDGLPSFHAPERRLRDFDFDFFFLGTATVISGLRDGHGYKQPNEVTGNAPNAANHNPRDLQLVAQRVERRPPTIGCHTAA